MKTNLKDMTPAEFEEWRAGLHVAYENEKPVKTFEQRLRDLELKVFGI